uniref:lysozyme n=2 Tax=Timema TaxID=61471 RepID=A0A7R8VND9_TIMDO|nr:unnamed protein product [Timema douglasi]
MARAEYFQNTSNHDRTCQQDTGVYSPSRSPRHLGPRNHCWRKVSSYLNDRGPGRLKSGLTTQGTNNPKLFPLILLPAFGHHFRYICVSLISHGALSSGSRFKHERTETISKTALQFESVAWTPTTSIMDYQLVIFITITPTDRGLGFRVELLLTLRVKVSLTKPTVAPPPPSPPSLNPTNTNVELEGFPVEHESCHERNICHGNIFSYITTSTGGHVNKGIVLVLSGFHLESVGGAGKGGVGNECSKVEITQLSVLFVLVTDHSTKCPVCSCHRPLNQVSCLFLSQTTQLNKPGPNYQEMELCLGCICEATTNCNLTIGCNNQGLCGPFLISQEYWIDAGTPVIRGDSPYSQGGGSESARKAPLTRDVMIPAYHRCVIEPYCAATTVRNYMRQFKQDCNQDSLFDCDDVARIHYLGGYQCGIDISHKGYYRVFKQCLNSIRQLTRT